MKPVKLLSLLLITLSPLSAGYTHVRTVTVNHGYNAQGSTMNDFPMVIGGTYSWLATVANGGEIQNTVTAGANSITVPADMIFTSDSACTSLLNWDVTSYNASSGGIYVYIRLPSFSASVDTTIYVCTGDTSTTTFLGNYTHTWKNYLAVWHGGDGTTIDFHDSTGNGHTCTNHGLTEASAIVGLGGSFNAVAASSQYADCGVTPFNLTSTFTIEAWTYQTGYNAAGHFPVPLGNVDSATTNGYEFIEQDGTGFYANCTQWNAYHSGTGHDDIINGNSCGLTINGVILWEGGYDGSSCFEGTNTVLLGGSSVFTAGAGCSGAGSNWVGASSQPLTIGSDRIGSATNVFFDGKIQEVRISSVFRRSTWYTTMFYNAVYPGAGGGSPFYSISSPTTVLGPTFGHIEWSQLRPDNRQGSSTIGNIGQSSCGPFTAGNPLVFDLNGCAVDGIGGSGGVASGSQITIGGFTCTLGGSCTPTSTVNGQTCSLGGTCNVNVGSAAHSFGVNQGNGNAQTGLGPGSVSNQIPVTVASADPVLKSFADLTPTAYVAGGGTANAQTVTLANPVTALTAGLSIAWLPIAANTSAAPTVAVSGLTAKPITKLGTAVLAANDLTTTAVAVAIYDGTEFQLQNPQTVSSGGGGGGTSATGALILLQSQTASSSATLDFTGCLTNDYDEYEIHFNYIVPATNNVSFQMRVGTGGTPTWDSGSNYTYGMLYSGIGDSPTQVSGSGVSAIDLAHNVSTTSNYSINGVIGLFNPGGSNYKFINGKTQAMAGGNMYQWGNTGIYNSTTAITAIRFLMSSGNIASGIIRCYGVSKTVTGPMGLTTTTPGLVLIQQQTASASAELDFTSCISSSYDAYHIVINSLVLSTTADLGIQVYSSGAYVTSSSYRYDFIFVYGAGTTGALASTAATSISFGGGTARTLASGGSWSADFLLMQPLGALYKLFRGFEIWDDNSLGLVSVEGSGEYTSSATVTGFRIIPSTGTITSGTVSCYGVIKTAVGTSAGIPGGGMTLLESHTASAASEVDFTTCFSTTYEVYFVTFDDIVFSAPGSVTSFQLQFHDAGSYDTASHYYSSAWAWSSLGSSVTGAGQTTFISLSPFSGRNVSTNTSYAGNGRFYIYERNAARYKRIDGSTRFADSVTVVPQRLDIEAEFQSTSITVDGFRLQANTGTFSGTMRCYGLANQ